MSKTPAVSFDYSSLIFSVGLNSEDTAFLEDCAHGVECGLKITSEGILEIGRALCAARDRFKGNDKAFGQWRESRLPFLTSHSSTRFIQVFDRFGANLLQHNVGVEISPTILYALAAPSTPDLVVTEITTRIQSGKKMKVKEVQEVIKQAKSNVSQFPAKSKPVSKIVPSKVQSETVDMMPLLTELGISKDWVSTYSHVFRHLESLYKNHFAGHDRDSYIAAFAQSLPDDQVLRCVYHLSDFLVKLLASLPVKKELSGG